jgi:hypothetical protein
MIIVNASQLASKKGSFSLVMPGLDPAIHVFLSL